MTGVFWFVTPIQTNIILPESMTRIPHIFIFGSGTMGGLNIKRHRQQKIHRNSNRFSNPITQLRVVACLRAANPWSLEEQLRAAVMNANLPSTATFANVSIVPVESIIDPVTVVIEESPQKKGRAFDKNLTFVAFDFDLIGDRDMALENYCANPCDGPAC